MVHSHLAARKRGRGTDDAHSIFGGSIARKQEGFIKQFILQHMAKIATAGIPTDWSSGRSPNKTDSVGWPCMFPQEGEEGNVM